MIRPPPRSTPFPYPTLFRSGGADPTHGSADAEGTTDAAAAASTGNSPERFHIGLDRKSTRLNSSHLVISYAVFCLKKKKSLRHDPIAGSHTVSGGRPAS